MDRELLLAAYITGVGLCVAGAGTHLYQWLSRQQVALGFGGATLLQALVHAAMVIVCGPYIMLQLGWRHEANGTISFGPALVSALVAFGWAFITGLLFVGAYVAIAYG